MYIPERLAGVFLVVIGILAGTSRIVTAEEPNTPSGSGLATVLDLATYPAVAKEPSLTEEQSGEIDAILTQRKQYYETYARSFRDGTDETRSDEERRASREKLIGQLTDVEKNIGKVLLPHQLDRLKQLAFQQSLRKDAASFGLLNPAIVGKLGLSDNQQEKIADAVKAHEAKMKEQFAQIRAEIEMLQGAGQREIMNQLTPEQRETYHKLYGTPLILDIGAARPK